MSCSRFALLLVLLAPSLPAVWAAGVDGPSIPPADERLIKSAQLDVSGPALLDFFRKRTPAAVPEQTLTALARQLGEPTAAAHHKAFAELVSYGSAAVPVLRRAANDLENPEAAERARRCLQLIEGPESAALVGAAARVLTLIKPAGAAEVLLAYLPSADDEQAAEEVMQALTAVALREGKPEPALLQALDDPLATRRAAAASVLSQVGGPEHRPAVRKLLQDPKPSVRLRAALALARAHDAEAVPVLIDLLAELPAEQVKPAEEYLTQLAGEWALTVPAGGDAVSRKLRRDLWLAWWRGTDGPALLEELRKRTLGDADREKIIGLIRQLDAVNPAAREQAVADLLALGSAAVPLLRQAVNDPDNKTRERAQQVLQMLNKSAAAPLPGAAIRLIALRKPAGAVEALLAFVPCAEDDEQLHELQMVLAALAYRDGNPDPVLLRALEDRAWQRRAAAAEALCQPGRDEQRDAVRKLLQDAEPNVRLRAALALIQARDRQAVPALINLLAELPAEKGLQAEAALRSLAAEQAPTASLSGAEGTREKCRDAWAAWWREHGHTVDLARLDAVQRLLGYTLVVEQYNNARRSGRVAEYDAAGKMRWEVTGLQTAFDAAVVPGDRVLIVEQGVNRVSERDFKGNILWQKPLNLPLAVQRLPNGNTFLAGRGQLLELDRNGKEVFAYPRLSNDIMAAQKLRDGQIALLTYSWNYIRLDAKGKEVKTFRLGPLPFYTNAVHFLPDDHVLIPEHNASRVVEFSPDGKRVWEASVPMPTGVERLPNGNVLVSSASAQRVVELNRAGKVVWEHKEAFNPWRAHRR